jgi:hypothetical protein
MKNISNHSKCYRRIPVRKTLQTSTRNKLVSNDLYPQTRYTHLIKRYMSSDQDNITRLAISEDLNNKIYKYYRALPGGEHVGTYTYEQKHLKNGNETVWTCYFQCPITGYKIYSGYIHPDLRKVVFGDDSTNIKWIQGKVYYSKKNHARRAAAALTMDCLGISSDVVEQYSNGLDSYNFCLETLPIDLPSKIQQASDADGNPISSIERKLSSYGELDSS